MKRLAVIALLGAACSRSSGTSPATFRSGQQVRVGAGDTFTVALDERTGVGDSWRVVSVGTSGIVEPISDSVVFPEDKNGATGVTGEHRFVFRASALGNTVITFHDCFRLCPGGEGDTGGQSDVSFDVTIR